MTDHPGRFKLQKKIGDRWITVNAGNSEYHVIHVAKEYDGSVRVWDSQDNRVVWTKEE